MNRPLSAVSLITLLGLTTTALAGPIAPPAGPVASTGKTLTEVEPRIAITATNTPGDGDSLFKITRPGSYYLTEDAIVSQVSGTGIEIAASGVTIDLNGFTIRAVGSPNNGILNNGTNSLTVRNGRIDGFSSKAITSFGVTRIEDVSVQGRGFVVVDRAIVRRCTLIGPETLITLSNSAVAGSLIEDCQITQTASSNVESVFTNTPSTTIRNCIVTALAPSAGFGIQVVSAVGASSSAGHVIENCTVRNHATGISVDEGVVRDCAVFNANTGIQVSSNSLIEGNRLVSCTIGINLVGSGSTVLRNRIRASTTPITNAAGDDVAPTGTAATSTNANANIVN